MKKIFVLFYFSFFILFLSLPKDSFPQNVGIGTSTPGFKLDVKGRMGLKAGTTGSIGTSAGIFMDDYRDASTRIFFGMQDSMRVGFYGSGAGGAGWAFNFHAQTGNVGIGVLNANNKLSVDGDIGVYTGNTLKGFVGVNNEDLMINAERHLISGGTARNLILQLSTPGFFPATAGYVGIGTDAPAGKLEIKSGGGLPQIVLNQTTEDDYSRIRMFSTHNSGHFFDISATITDGVNGIGITYNKDILNFYNSLIGNFMSFVVSEGIIGGNTIAAGINATPSSSYILNVGGLLRCESVFEYSDNRFKKNVLPLQQALDKVMQLNPVLYDWKNVGDFKFTDRSRQIGFLAQELEQVIPEVVSTDSEGYKAVNYSKLTAVLTAAIKEQQLQIQQLQEKIELQQHQQSLLIRKLQEEMEVLKKKADF